MALHVSELTGLYYWWRANALATWELCMYDRKRQLLKFFNGSHMSDTVWGELVEVTIPVPGVT